MAEGWNSGADWTHRSPGHRHRRKAESLLCRYADDWVCALRYREDAERFYRVLPKRLEKFNLKVAPEKTRLLRFSRFHPSMKRRFTFFGL